MQKRIGSLVAASAVALMLAPTPAAADDDYYKGKTIQFMVGFGVGGGYDAYSRMLAPHFAQRLGATVVVVNQPGAGGMNSLNRFARAPADGLRLTLVNGTGAATQQILGVKGVRFDLTKLKYLAITDFSRWVFLVQPKSPYNTVEDVMNANEPIRFGASGRLDALGVGATFACHAIKLNCQIIGGYKGSATVALALAQGEVDALYVSETSAFNYVKSGNAKAITTWNRKRAGLFPDLRAITEVLSLKDDQLWWIDIRNTIEGLGRMLVAPPGTPKARVDTLRATANAILTDKSVIAEANKRKRFIRFIKASEAERMVRRVLTELTPKEKADIKDLLMKKK
ncbi:MAG: tripartite tricarboxylate transporter substrate-binding protein [Proteobacteria bacterium]|nr:tripartite tricarboxylate transporter substrate-binding protein [Pseudomonadota bacterium]